jgi:hypothetical protein
MTMPDLQTPEQIPQNYGYAPYPQYYPTYQSGPHPAVQVGFWIFYALIGVWVDLALTISLWVCALVLPLTLPLVALVQNNYLPQGWTVRIDGWDGNMVQTEAMLYSTAGVISVIGLILLVFAILTVKPWFKFHRFIFRELGGVRI